MATVSNYRAISVDTLPEREAQPTGKVSTCALDTFLGFGVFSGYVGMITGLVIHENTVAAISFGGLLLTVISYICLKKRYGKTVENQALLPGGQR